MFFKCSISSITFYQIKEGISGYLINFNDWIGFKYEVLFILILIIDNFHRFTLLKMPLKLHTNKLVDRVMSVTFFSNVSHFFGPL